MGKRLFLSVAVGGLLLLGIAGVCLAGVEPSSFEPEINKLHSANYLNAMANQLQGLQTRLEEVLLAMPFDIVEHIVSRMDIESSSWLPSFRDVSIRIIKTSNAHILPVLPPLPPPQLLPHPY